MQYLSLLSQLVGIHETWNAECRRGDLEDASELPLWDPLEGTGCEGMMTPIPRSNETDVTVGKNATMSQEGVPLHRVHEMLYEMHQLEQAMYRNETETNDKDKVV